MLYCESKNLQGGSPVDMLLKQFINNAPEAILISDREGIITFWNVGAERILGYTVTQAIGSSLDLIIPGNLRARHWEGYRRVMAAGETKYKTGLLTSPGLRKDGSRVSLEFSMVLLRDEQGRVEGCASIMRDVSERWNREKELKARLAECESKLSRAEK